MKLNIFVLVFGLFTVSVFAQATQSAAAGAVDPDTDPVSDADIGTWKISRILYKSLYKFGRDGVTPLPRLTDRQAHRMLGKTIAIGQTEGIIDPTNGEHCYPLRRLMTADRPVLFGAERIAQNETLGLPDKVVIFIHGCLEFWLRTDGNLVTELNGYWFELTPVKEASKQEKDYTK